MVVEALRKWIALKIWIGLDLPTTYDWFCLLLLLCFNMFQTDEMGLDLRWCGGVTFFFPHALLRFVEKATIKGMLCYECVSVLITTNTQPQLFWDWIQWQIHFESTKGATAPKVFKLMLHL